MTCSSKQTQPFFTQVKLVQKYLFGFQVFQWSLYSSDFNPIENVFDTPLHPNSLMNSLEIFFGLIYIYALILTYDRLHIYLY